MTLLTGWGRTAPSAADVAAPADAGAVAAALRDAGPRGVLPRGAGRAYGDAAQNAGGSVLATGALGGVRAFDAAAGTVTVGAGMTFDALVDHVLADGWFVPVTPGTAHVTIGGAIAADIHGKNHHRDGALSSHLEGFTLVTPGGDVVACRPGDDAFRATVGGMGLTGVVTEATLRLLPVTSAYCRVDTERATDLDDALARMSAGDDAYRYSVAWIDCLARGRRMGRSVLLRGDHAGAEECGAAQPLARARGPRVPAPPWAPSGLLNRVSIAAFNEAYYRRAPRAERGRIEPLDAFFYPLDAVRGWNRLYGRDGFLQYQLLVPFGAEEALRACIQRLSGGGVASFLAVLKRFGPQADPPLSFPAPGWTLALDIPAGLPGLAQLLDGLDELVAAAGGRLYLAKDSRLRPDLLARMYPGLEEWRALQAALDPRGVMQSDLSRRLGLVPRRRTARLRAVA